MISTVPLQSRGNTYWNIFALVLLAHVHAALAGTGNVTSQVCTLARSTGARDIGFAADALDYGRRDRCTGQRRGASPVRRRIGMRVVGRGWSVRVAAVRRRVVSASAVVCEVTSAAMSACRGRRVRHAGGLRRLGGSRRRTWFAEDGTRAGAVEA